MTPEDRNCLDRIRQRYGAILSESAAWYGHRMEILAGIMMRETAGGESKWLDVPGPGGRGDGGHGHGLMQIDDRSFPDFCRSEDWKDPAKNVDMGARILAEKRHFLATKQFPIPLLERGAIAAYNCGEGNVLKAHLAGEDLDIHTADHNYSACVMAFADAYVGICPPAAATAPETILVAGSDPDPNPDPVASPWQSLAAMLWRLILKLLVGRKAVSNDNGPSK